MQLSIGYGRSGSVSCRGFRNGPFKVLGGSRIIRGTTREQQQRSTNHTKSFHSIILFLSKNTAECRTLLDMIEGNREAIL